MPLHQSHLYIQPFDSQLGPPSPESLNHELQVSKEYLGRQRGNNYLMDSNLVKMLIIVEIIKDLSCLFSMLHTV